MFKISTIFIVLAICFASNNAYAKTDFDTQYPDVIHAMRTYNQDIISTDLSHPVPADIIKQDKQKLIDSIDSVSNNNKSVIKAKVDLKNTLKNFDDKITNMKPVWTGMADLVASYEISN